MAISLLALLWLKPEQKNRGANDQSKPCLPEPACSAVRCAWGQCALQPQESRQEQSCDVLDCSTRQALNLEDCGAAWGHQLGEWHAMSWNGDTENSLLMKVSMQTLQSSSESEEAYRRRPVTGAEYSVSAPLQLSPLGRGIH